MARIGKWLTVSEMPQPGKITRRWQIKSNHGDYLGQVYWFGRWRQYIFEPDYGCVFNKGCLDDISKFLNEQNGQQKVEAAKRRAGNE